MKILDDQEIAHIRADLTMGLVISPELIERMLFTIEVTEYAMRQPSYESGYEDGEQNGYDNGYDDGYSDAERECDCD